VNKRKTLYICFILIFTTIFLYNLYNILNWYFNYNKEITYLNNISNQEDIIDDVKTKYYDEITQVTSTPFLEVDFSKLKSINNSTVGWISVNGTNINYPFVQTTDNDFYLTHSFEKKYNNAGWVFLDYRNKSTLENQNNIIYAHSQTNNTMFGTLKNVLQSEWYENTENHVIKLSTETQNSIWQIFSIYIIPTTNDYLEISFNNNFTDFCKKLSKRSIYEFDVSIKEDDKIITLSTCHGHNKKLVVHAKLVKNQQRI